MKTFVISLALYTREPAGTRQCSGSAGLQKTRPKMTENASRSIVAASTTDLAEVGTVDREVGSVDARLRRRRKLAPARSKSSALPAALRVIIDKPCAPPRNRPSAPKFPPPCGPCFAIEAGLFFCQGHRSCRTRPAGRLSVASSGFRSDSGSETPRRPADHGGGT